MKRTAALKTGATCLSLLYFVTQCALAGAAETNLFAERRRAKASALAIASLPPSPRSLSARLPLPDLLSQLPASYGTVRAVKGAAGGGQIVYIQDVHRHDEAQRRIGEAVRALAAGGATLLALEGASGDIDLAPFRSSPFKDSQRRAVEGLLADHKISGAVWGAIGAASSLRAVGVEDPALYLANVRAVRDAASRAVEAKARLTDRRRTLNGRKARTYAPRLAAFDRIIQRYRAGDIGIGAYADAVTAGAAHVPANVRKFLEAVRYEKNLDAARAEEERRALLQRLTPRLSDAEAAGLVGDAMAYRTGRLTPARFYAGLSRRCEKAGVPLTEFPALHRFIRYVLLADDINAARLYEQLLNFETQRYTRLAQTAAERALTVDDARLHLEEKLANFSLTTSEWKAYGELTHDAGPLLKPFERFYELAEARNAAIARNLRAAMRAHGARRVILVTGGFHEAGVSAAIGNDVAVATFVPRITQLDASRPASVINLFTQQKEPLDRLFAGEKIFLAEPPVAAEARAGADVMTAAGALRAGTPIAVVSGWLSSVMGRTVHGFTMAGRLLRLQLRQSGSADIHLSVPFDPEDRPRWPSLERVGGFVRSAALNSVFISAALTAAAGLILNADGGATTLMSTAAIFLAVRAWIFIRVIWHERGHSLADGQLAGLSPGKRIAHLLKSIGGPSGAGAVRGFVLGTEILTAGVRSRLSDPEAVRRVSLAGPLVHLRGLVFGLTLLLLSAGLSSLSAPALAAAFTVTGALLVLTEAVLLAISLSSDLPSWRSGRRPAFYGMSSADKSFEGERGDLQPGIRLRLQGMNIVDLNSSIETLVGSIVAQLSRQFGGPLPRRFSSLARTIITDIARDAIEKDVNEIWVRSSVSPEYQIVLEIVDNATDAEPFNTEALVGHFHGNDDWKLGAERRSDGKDGRSVQFSYPADAPPLLSQLPRSGAELLLLSRKMARTTLTGLREDVERLAAGASRDRRALPEDVIERLGSYLWIADDDQTLFAQITNLMRQPPRDNRADVFTAELVKIVHSTDVSDDLRRMALWTLSHLAAHASEPSWSIPGLFRWNYGTFDWRSISSDTRTEVRQPVVGLTAIEVLRPTRGWARFVWFFSRFIPWLRRTYTEESIATFEFSHPGYDGDASSDASWTGKVRVEAQGPGLTPEIFSAVMGEWARLAPIGAVLYIDPPLFARSDDWHTILEDHGFELTDLGAGDTRCFTKTAAAGRERPRTVVSSVFRDVSLGKVIFVAFRLIEVALIVPFYVRNILLVRPEWFHRIGAVIEGVYYRKSPSLLAIQFGFVPWEEVTTVFEVPMGRMVTNGAPPAGLFLSLLRKPFDVLRLRRDLKTLAEPLGYLLSALAFTIAAGVILAIHLSGGAPWPAATAVMVVYAWIAIEVTINWIAVLMHLLRPHSDFWLWYNDRGKDPNTGSQTLEEYLTSIRRTVFSGWGSLASALAHDAYQRLLALFRRMNTANFVAGKLLAARDAALEPEARALDRARRRMVRFEKEMRAEVPLEVIEELHQAEWANHKARIENPFNPLLGAAPRGAEGRIIADETLRPYFTDAGWRALHLYRARRAGEADLDALPAGLLIPTGGIAFRLTVKALKSESRAAFFALLGKPSAAFDNVDADLLDTEAQPWVRTGTDSKYGSVQSELHDRPDSDARRLLNGEVARHAAAIAAGRFIGLVSRPLSTADELYLYRRLLVAAGSVTGSTKIDERKLAIIRKHYPFVARHSVFADPYGAIRGMTDSGVQRQTPMAPFSARPGSNGAFLLVVPPGTPPAPPPSGAYTRGARLSPDGTDGNASRVARGGPAPSDENGATRRSQPRTDSPSIRPHAGRDTGGTGAVLTPGQPEQNLKLSPGTPRAADETSGPRATRPPRTSVAANHPRSPEDRPAPVEASFPSVAAPDLARVTASVPASRPVVIAVPLTGHPVIPARTAAARSGRDSTETGPGISEDPSSSAVSASKNPTVDGRRATTGLIPDLRPLVSAFANDRSAAVAAVAVAEMSAQIAERSRRQALTEPRGAASTDSPAGAAAVRPASVDRIARPIPTSALRAATVYIAGATLAFSVWTAAVLLLDAPFVQAAAAAILMSILFIASLALGRAALSDGIQRISLLLSPSAAARAALASVALTIASAVQAVPALHAPRLPASAAAAAVSFNDAGSAATPVVAAARTVPAGAAGRAAVPASTSFARPDPSAVARRSAALAALDGFIAAAIAARNASPVEVAADLAEGRLDDLDRAFLRDLVRATRQAARLAAVRSGAMSTFDSKTDGTVGASPAGDDADVDAVLREFKDVALVLSGEPGALDPEFLEDEDRQDALSKSVERGRALLVLQEAWAREIVGKGATRSGEEETADRSHVRVLRISDGGLTDEETLLRATESGDASRDGGRDDALPVPSDDAAADDRTPASSDEDPAGADDASSERENRLLVAFRSEAPAGVPVDVIVASAIDNAGRLSSKFSGPADVSSNLSAPDTRGDVNAAINNSFFPATFSRTPAQRLETSRRLTPTEDFGANGPAGRFIRATIVAAAVGLGVIATFVGLDVRPVLAISLTFGGAVLVLGAVRASRAAAGKLAIQTGTASGDGPPVVATSAEEGELARLADLFIRFAGRADRLRTAAGALDLAILLPEIGTLGVADRRLISRVAGLSPDETARLEALIAERRASGAFKPALDIFAARAATAALAMSGATIEDLERALGNKDAVYPVRATGRDEMEREMDGIGRLLLRLGDGSRLYLAVADGEPAQAAAVRFGADIAAGRVALLPQASALVSSRHGTDVLSLAALAQGIAGLGEARLRNLIVLLPEGLGWDDSGVGRGTALDWVGFVLLRDFVAGIPIEKVGLINLGRLAQMISTQA